MRADSQEQARYSEDRSRWLFTLVIVLFWMSLYVYVPILPVFAADRGASLGAVGLILSTYGFSQMILRLPLGIISDRAGLRKPFVSFGLVTAALSGIGLSLSPNPLALGFFRLLGGVAASTWVVTTVLYFSFYSPGDTVRAAGRASFFSAAGQLVASAGGGAIVQFYGWQAPFWIGAGLAVLGLVFLLSVPEKASASASSFSLQHTGRILANRTLLSASIAAAAVQFVGYATTYGFAPILADRIGSSGTELGMLASAMQISSMVSAGLVGLFLTSRLEKWAAITGLLALCLASIGLAASHSIGFLTLTRILHGIGAGLSMPVLMGAAVKRFQASERASAMGVFQAIYAVGMFAGSAAAGQIAQAFGLEWMFVSSGILVLAAIPLLVWGLSRPADKPVPDPAKRSEKKSLPG